MFTVDTVDSTVDIVDSTVDIVLIESGLPFRVAFGGVRLSFLIYGFLCARWAVCECAFLERQSYH